MGHLSLWGLAVDTWKETSGEDSPVSVDMVQSIGGTHFNIIGTRGLELN